MEAKTASHNQIEDDKYQDADLVSYNHFFVCDFICLVSTIYAHHNPSQFTHFNDLITTTLPLTPQKHMKDWEGYSYIQEW